MSSPNRIFTAEPAKRERVPLLIGIASPSGGGKTFSALRLATGIQRVMPGEICLIDTENRRALHYADKFQFTHIPFGPPFGSQEYLAAIRFAANRHPSVIIIDSMTHEHTGEGGYLEIVEKFGAYPRGFAHAGPIRQSMIEGIKQISGPNFICCWRAREKTKPVTNSKGKIDVVDMGLMPLGGEEWIYEMTIQCLLPPRSDGVPQWGGQHVGERMMMKLPLQFQHLFKDNPPLSESIGEQMARWAAGGPGTQNASQPVESATHASPPQPEAGGEANPPPAEPNSGTLLRVEKYLRDEALKGRKAFVSAWNGTEPRLRAPFLPRRDQWLAMANEVDELGGR